MAKYDVLVIGAGPGGYACAIRAAQLGLKAGCVEGRPTLGGTCLNVGCIPSKALLHATAMYHEAESNFRKMGLSIGKLAFDWKKVLSYKDKAIKENTAGIEYLFKKNGVDWLKGWGRIAGPGVVEVDGQTHEAGSIVIASGSEPAGLEGIEVDEKSVVTSTGALALESVPDRLAVIGAGVIGLELGSVFARLGAKVVFLEYLDSIAAGMDREMAAAFQRLLKRQGMKFILGAEVRSLERSGGALSLAYRKRGGEDELSETADVVLVATGRRPVTEGLGLEEAGVETDPRGFAVRDDARRTTAQGIYVIGDATAGPMLAHKAEDEGIAVAETLAGRAGHVNYDVIPSVVYTHPEASWVGRTEEELKSDGAEYKASRFPFKGNGRAKATFASDGMVKILADEKTDRILGCHILGPSAGELIHEIAVAMEFGAAAEDVARTCHAHPTYSEAVREAALACGDGPIHA